MASLTQRLFLLQLVILSLSIISTNARPCKTLFISSYSFSFKQNPSSSGVVTVIFVFPVNDEVQDRPIERDDMPFGLGYKKSLSSSSNYDYSSLWDRTKDILSVVVALLFGVGCGALTAATMYLAWSLFSNRFYDFRYGSPYSDDDEDDHDDDVNTKKLGYVKIPAADSVPAPALAPAAAMTAI
ncbi:hypothetical protein I3842_03G249700 [Carya illinoinensis]|uniref:Transmembrane protein n=1 Tax=Carya illinoinensis TaxID=32201 RepID=A0A922K0M7_CARIL|nr:hypothetical protein I3842_03G249700 [Carya illinoinensis]